MTTLRRLLGLALPFWRRMLLAAFLGFLTIAASVGLLATSAWLIAKAALQPSIAELQVAIVGVRFFGIARGVFRYLERLVAHDTTFRLLARLRAWFYQALEPLAPARLMQYRSGDLLSRIYADVETLQDFFVRVIAPPLAALMVAALMAVFMGSFSLGLALLLLGFLFAAGVGVPALTGALGRAPGRALVADRAVLQNALLDGVQGMADLLAYGQAAGQLEAITELSATYTWAQGRMALINGLHTALGHALMYGAVVAALLVAVPLVEPVYLASLALATLASFEAVQPLPLAFQYLAGNLAAAARLFEMVDADPAVTDSADSPPVPQAFTLQVADLHFHYLAQAMPALDGVSFTLGPSQRIAVVGPSGAGKSTLLNVLLRFYDCPPGSVFLDGRDIRAYSGEDVRRRIGVVAQRTHLFNTTIRQNIALARPEATDAQVIAAAQAAQIHDFVLSLPQGYDTLAGELGARLSGGERQRIAIARTLLEDAPLLALDEATANLDAATERAVMQTVLRVTEGRALLVITHRLVGLEAMDTILVMDRGRIVEQGTQDDLLRQGGLYWRMWSLQNQLLGQHE